MKIMTKKTSKKKKSILITIMISIMLLFSAITFAYTVADLDELLLNEKDFIEWIDNNLDLIEANGLSNDVTNAALYESIKRKIKDSAFATISAGQLESVIERRREQRESKVNAQTVKDTTATTTTKTNPSTSQTQPSSSTTQTTTKPPYQKINWSKVSTNSSNWMANIPDSRYLHEINMPGTHDSGTKKVDAAGTGLSILDAVTNIAENYAKCQSLNITEQLNAGVRVFDVRVDDDKTIRLCHGSGKTKYYCVDTENNNSKLTLKNFCSLAWNWMKQHTSETVCIIIKNEDGSASTTAGYVNEFIKQNADKFYTGTTYPKLGSVRNKFVILTRLTNVTGLNYSISDNTKGTKTVDGVTIYYEDHYDCSASSKKTYLKDAFTEQAKYEINTSGGKGTKTGFIFASSYTTLNNPNEIAKSVNPYVESYSLKQGAPYGIVLFNYVTESLAKKIYQTNP